MKKCGSAADVKLLRGGWKKGKRVGLMGATVVASRRCETRPKWEIRVARRIQKASGIVRF